MPKLPSPKGAKSAKKNNVQMQSTEELSQLNPYYKKLIDDINDRDKKLGLSMSEEDPGLTVEKLANMMGKKIISSL